MVADSLSGVSLTPPTLTLSRMDTGPKILVLALMAISLENELRIFGQLCLFLHINRTSPNWHSKLCVPMWPSARLSGLFVTSRNVAKSVFKIHVHCTLEQ